MCGTTVERGSQTCISSCVHRNETTVNSQVVIVCEAPGSQFCRYSIQEGEESYLCVSSCQRFANEQNVCQDSCNGETAGYVRDTFGNYKCYQQCPTTDPFISYSASDIYRNASKCVQQCSIGLSIELIPNQQMYYCTKPTRYYYSHGSDLRGFGTVPCDASTTFCSYQPDYQFSNAMCKGYYCSFKEYATVYVAGTYNNSSISKITPIPSNIVGISFTNNGSQILELLNNSQHFIKAGSSQQAF